MKTRSPHLLIALALLIVCSGHVQWASSIDSPPPLPESVLKQLGNMGEGTGSTDTGDLAYYMKRPRLQGDLHGFGSFLLAGAEIVRMEQPRGR